MTELVDVIKSVKELNQYLGERTIISLSTMKAQGNFIVCDLDFSCGTCEEIIVSTAVSFYLVGLWNKGEI